MNFRCSLHRLVPHSHITRIAAALAALGGLMAVAQAQSSWVMRDFDLARTSVNASETILNPTNVNAGQFGKLYTRPVDGQIYAQPLVVAAVAVPNKGPMTLVYVATMHNSVYAFDAEHGANGAPVWQRSFIDPVKNVTTVPYYYLTRYTDIHPEVGIVSTPALDVPNNTMFVVAKTLEGDPNIDASFHQRLHVLDMRTGADKVPPIELSAQVPGTGDGSVNGVLSYNARRQNQRSGLIVANGRLYIPSASHGDSSPYHGWILVYDAKTFKFLGSYCSTPNGGLGGFWMSGHAIPIDAAGNLYPVSGNGDYNPAAGDFGDSLLKISGTTLKLLDSFTPYDQGNMDAWDLDYGSCGSILIPQTNLVVSGGKEGKLYLNDRAKLGVYDGVSDNQIVQWWWACNGEILGTPTYFNGSSGNKNLYVWSENDQIKGFHFNGVTFDTTPFAVGDTSDGYPTQGAYMTVSSNGPTDASAIVWANVPLRGNSNWDTPPGILRAYRATDLKEIWHSQMIDDDNLGAFAKMNPPVVVNGKVYMATFGNQLAVYGELPPAVPNSPRALEAEAGHNEVALTWKTPRAASSFEIRRGPPGGPYVKVGTVSGATSYDDTTAKDGKAYGYAVYAMNVYGTSPASNVAMASPSAQQGGTGAGIPAVYYNDTGLPAHFIKAELTRTDATINFDWGTSQPDPAVQQSLFSVIWSGEIVAPATGLYTLQTISDDGVRLWLKGAPVVDDWTDHAPTSDYTNPIMMVAGKHYPLQMEMYQDQGGAVAKLLWAGPGMTGYSVIPTTALFSPSVPSLPLTGSISLAGAFNMDGISGISNPADGNMAIRQSLAGELLPDILKTNSLPPARGTTFAIGPKFDGLQNVVQCDGSTVLMPATAGSKVQILGASIAGSQSGTFTLQYSDGSSAPAVATFTDWGAPAPQNSEFLGARFNRRHSPAGFVMKPTSLFWYALPTDPVKRLVAIQLPNNPKMKILAVTLR